MVRVRVRVGRRVRVEVGGGVEVGVSIGEKGRYTLSFGADETSWSRVVRNKTKSKNQPASYKSEIDLAARPFSVGMQCTGGVPQPPCIARALSPWSGRTVAHAASLAATIAANLASLAASSSGRPTALAARCRARAAHALVSASCHLPGARRRAQVLPPPHEPGC